MLARLARNMGDRLALALGLPQEAAERAAYSLELLLLDILTFAAIILAAWLTGLFWPALVAATTTAIMRTASGGAHSKSPWVCLLLSVVLAVLCGYAGTALSPKLGADQVFILIILLALGSLTLVLVYAPADTDAKPISGQQKKSLKVVSLVIVICWVLALLLIPLRSDVRLASAAGMVWQIFTITPAGYGLSRALDRTLRVKEV